MRNKKGQFIKGSKPSKKCIDAIKEYYRNKPKKRVAYNCTFCKKVFEVYPYRKDVKFCSHSCKAKNLGIKRMQNVVPVLMSSGYMFIKIPSHHRANKSGYVKIADLVLELKIGRPLKKNEIAHHIDECKTNDSPNNLEVMTKKEHDTFHTKKRWDSGTFFKKN